ncbi:MAG: hypothetical protein R3C03_11340 [Pirellulaceae bacterium]
MRIPRYWSRKSGVVETDDGERETRSVWGWSVISQEDAAHKAAEMLSRTLDAARANRFDPDGYGYECNPPREEIIEEFGDSQNPSAVITRNGYGSLVLNTAELMFIDIDVPPEKISPVGFLSKLFGVKPQPTNADLTLDRIRNWSQQHRDMQIRIYRTLGGYRIAITNERINPESDRSENILSELGSDPLYRRLCQVQKSFRARLTPKYWRLQNCKSPPGRYPFESPGREQNFRQWVDSYEQKSAGHATCRFVEQLGNSGVMCDGFDAIVKLHDVMSRADEDLPLA